MNYYSATICKNGHVISNKIAYSQAFCDVCGSDSTSACSSCGEEIRGLRSTSGAYRRANPLVNIYKKPSYCHSCGNPFSWTEKLLSNAVELLSLDEELDENTKEVIKSAFPDLIVETPNTPLAVARYQKFIPKASLFVRDGLYSLLVDVVSETAKKALTQ